MVKFEKALIGGSLVLLVTFNLFNLLNFIFQFAMARMLSVSDYGTLATLFSIVYIVGIFSESIQTIMTKYSSNESNSGKIKNLVKRSLRKSFVFSSAIFVAYLLLMIFFSPLLKIGYSLLALNGLMIFTSFLLPISRGVLQGKKKFKDLGINVIIEAIIKLLLAVVLVFVGWKVYGAIIATVLGAFVSLALSFSMLKPIFKSKKLEMPTQGIYNYSTPVFFVLLSLILFYSLDVIIAKIVFPEEIAGAYAIASVLAKIVFIGTQPISKAMFPLSAESKTVNKSENILINSYLIILGLIVIALLITFFFSDLIVLIFSGKYVSSASGVLFYLSIGTSLLSIASLNLFYKLSIGKTKGFAYLFVIVLLEIILLFYFSSNIFLFSIAFITSSAIYLWGAVFLVGR